MTLQLQLSAELEQRLLQEAARCGQPGAEIALRLLDHHLPPVEERRAAALALLQRWTVEDASLTPEEANSNAAVLRQLDEDRPSRRKLFADLLPDEPT